MDSRIVYTSRSRQKKSRFTKGKVYALLGFFVFALAAGGSVYALRYPDWQIIHVSITGLEKISPDDVRRVISQELTGSVAFVMPKSSYFLFDSARAEARAREAFPRLETIEIKKEFPSTLSVTAHERGFWAMYCIESGACGYIDATGFLYETAPASTGSLILKITSDASRLDVPSEPLARDLAQSLGRFASMLEEKTDEKAQEFIISQNLLDEFKVRTQSGFLLFVKRDDDYESVLRVLDTVLKEEVGNKKSSLEYIDLRFGNKVFYKSR